MKAQDYWSRQIKQHVVLSPVERTSEVLFGLIMVLSFTGAISAATDGREEIRSLLWAALGCNVAWGLVDAIMYLMNIVFDRGYARKILIRIKKTKPGAESVNLLREEIQPVLSELMDDSEINKLGDKMRQLPEPPIGVLLTLKDFYSAFKIFLLVFLCTLPVALPFGIFKEPALALRISNGMALALLFIGGYNLARHAGFKPLLSALVYMLIGVALVVLTIALGG